MGAHIFETIEFDLDMELPEPILTDLENQIVQEVAERYDGKYTTEDIEDYKYIFKARVTIRKDD